MEGHYEVDERRWREKVRRLMFDLEAMRKERDAAKDELSMFLAKPVNSEPDTATLDAEIAALKNEIKGLRMQLGRYKKHENKG